MPHHLAAVPTLEISPELPDYLQGNKGHATLTRKSLMTPLKTKDLILESFGKNMVMITNSNPYFQRIQLHHVWVFIIQYFYFKESGCEAITKSYKSLETIISGFESIINLKIAMMKEPPQQQPRSNGYRWAMLILIMYILIRNRQPLAMFFIGLLKNYFVNLSD